MSAPVRHVEPAPPGSGGWIRRLLPYLMAHKRNAILAFGLAVVGQGLTALAPLIQAVLIDDVLIAHTQPLWPWLGLMIVLGAISFVSGYWRRYTGQRISLDVQYDLRNSVFEHLQRLDFAAHDNMQTGQLMSRATADVTLLERFLAQLPNTLGNIVQVIVAIIAMLFLSAPLTIIALICIPTLLGIATTMRVKLFPANWHAQQRQADVAGVVEEAVSGVRVVKAFGQEQWELGRLIERGRDQYRSRMRVVRLQARYQPTLQAIPTLAQTAVIGFGGWMAINGNLSLGAFLAFLSYLVQLTAPVRMMAGLITQSQQARAGAERVLDVLDSNPLVAEKPDAEPLPPVRGKVQFSDVTFGYLRSDPVLRGLELTVEPGERVAVVGASGSGKSTIALLVPRFYDVAAGSVRIDGVDVRDVTFQSLRSQVGVVFEDSFLFSERVRDNIAYGKPDATDDDIEAAARAAEAHDFIMALPDGYDTVVGERGLTLSGGQRQRIALARALITDPGIMILDDATSSIDSKTEEGIHDSLRRIMADRTTILVAHRRSTLRLADRIVVLDQGELVASGTHEELVATCELYRDLLTGPGESAEGVAPEAPEVELVRDLELVEIDAEAWPDDAPEAEGARSTAAQGTGFAVGRAPGAGGWGAGGMGGGGGWGAVAAFAPPTPELLEQVDKLPRLAGEPDVDLGRETAPDRTFSLRRFIRPFRWALVIGFVLVVIDTVTTLVGPSIIQQAIQQGIEPKSTEALMTFCGIYLVVQLVSWVNSYAQQRQTGRTAERMLYALRVRTFAQLQRLSLGYYDRESDGRIMTRMTTDIDALAQLLQQGLLSALVNILSLMGVAVILFSKDAEMTLAVLVVFPPLIIATLAFRKASARAYNTARDRVAVVNSNLQESLSGVRVAQAMRREQGNIERFRDVASDYLDARVTSVRLQALYFPFVQFIQLTAKAIVLGFAYYNPVNTAVLIAFLLQLDMFFSPIQQLSQVFDQWQQAQVALQRIDELLKTPSGTPEADDAVEPGRIRGDIRFENVRFAYPNTAFEALRGIDLHITPGQVVALVGETGAGKSTIVKLVARFYDPSSGRVLVDDVPLTDLDLAGYRHQLGYVPQEAFLFSGSVRDNIAYGKPDATREEVEAAARAVGAHEFISGLAHGYLTAVAERGRSLSAGQRQLICLARARLVDPAVLILDEATANLDLATETRVQRAMGAVAQGRTTLLIAHRLQTGRSADRILVIGDGEILEDGTHEDLLAAGGRYSELWSSFAQEETAPAA